MKSMNINGCKRWLEYVGVILFTIHCSLFLVSCSKDTEEEDEHANWKQRNDAVIDQWSANSALTTYKSFTKSPTTAGKNSDYIFVEVLEKGPELGCPLYTDTVRVMYRGRLIPSKTYPEGEVFDETYSGNFDWKTANAQDFVCSALVDGFTTAVMHMNAGDRWRVHIPYTLGYGSSGSSSAIPAYSDLIFEVALLDFWSPGDKRPSFKTR